MRFVTITTDFGMPSGSMKGVIWGISPGSQITDISWSIRPQNVYEAAMILDRQVYYFPKETVHVIVVDPGVGTHRRPIAARIGDYFYVAPDNGVLTPMLERAEREEKTVKIVHTDNPKYWLPEVSNIFHGRDIFAPVGGHIASGVKLDKLGPVITDAVRLDLPRPEAFDGGMTGQISDIYEHFGNIITNIHKSDMEHLGDVDVTLCGTTIEGMVRTFGERPEGSLVALFDECGYLYVAVTNGNAAKRLGASQGDKVVIKSRKG
ncbi:MAG: SAM-dependent chlorinase/fluorinase [Anaerolineales bacterium]|nr:SAM-dependent chlorinase/fluorinase [Anaerolineales bacterium]